MNATRNPPDEPAIPAVLHVDTDGARHIYGVHRWEHPWADDPIFETGLRSSLEFFDRLGVRATYFVIAEALASPRAKELYLEAKRRGHSFASHTITHRLLTELSKDEKRKEIRDSKTMIEDALGVRVRGFRAPAFAIDRETLELIAEAGYDYDSSLFPDVASARKIGIDRVPAAPFRPAGLGIQELPLPRHRPLPWPFHPCYSLVLGDWYFRLGLWAHLRSRVPTVVLFHLTDFADPMPAERLPSRGARWFTLSHLGAAEKLRRLESMIATLGRRRNIQTTDDLLGSADRPAAASNDRKAMP